MTEEIAQNDSIEVVLAEISNLDKGKIYFTPTRQHILSLLTDNSNMYRYQALNYISLITDKDEDYTLAREAREKLVRKLIESGKTPEEVEDLITATLITYESLIVLDRHTAHVVDHTNETLSHDDNRAAHAQQDWLENIAPQLLQYNLGIIAQGRDIINSAVVPPTAV